MALIICIGLSFNTADANEFDDNKIFPGWTAEKKPVGVLGENGGDLEALKEKDSTKQGLLLFLPKVINYALIVVGAIVIVTIIWAGLKLLIAQGSDENHEKSKQVFQYAIIGFLFAVSAYTIVRIIYEIMIDKAAAS